MSEAPPTSPRDDGLDLTPRAPRARGRRRWPAFLVGALLVAGVGFLVVKMLDEASVYFYTADEAVAQRAELGDDRFRLQGTVLPGTLQERPTGVDFTVVFEETEVPVTHTGAPPDLFREGMPVVLEGRWSDEGDLYESDEILVKHDEVYVEDNPDRLDEADEQLERGAPPRGADPERSER